MKAVILIVALFLLIIKSLIGQISSENKKFIQPDTTRMIRQSDSYKNIDNMPIIRPDSNGKLIIRKPDKSVKYY